MKSIEIKLTEDQNYALRTLALQTGKSMEELIHEAIAQLTVSNFRTKDQTSLKIGKGLWKDRDDPDRFRSEDLN